MQKFALSYKGRGKETVKANVYTSEVKQYT